MLNYNPVLGSNYNLIKKINWQENALIWWHSEMLHNSGDFKESGIKSKQYFITHTYV